MLPLDLLAARDGAAKVLALGAHCDDIEIGCGGTLLHLLETHRGLDVLWVVFCSSPARAAEARASAADFLRGAATTEVIVREYRDGFLPYSGAEVKEDFEAIKRRFNPDLIFTHYREDRHQDHRVISDLTWNTWRDHWILEYEIPKYDGDFGTPNVFCALPTATVARKLDLVLHHFQSQAGRKWMTRDLLEAVPRIRGMECAAPDRVAEGFYGRKIAIR
jgi:LmbE family N-acetylglucosaminyl deacetylase